MAIDENSKMTSYRQTYITFDLPEQILTAPVFRKTRTAPQINIAAQNGKADPINSYNIRYWPSLGAWTLDYIQSIIPQLHEYDAYKAVIVTLDKFNTILYNAQNNQTGMDQEFLYRNPSDLTGILNSGTSMMQSPQSDPFIKKKVPGGSSWKLDIGSGYRAPALDLPEDRVGESFNSYPPDQGFFLRWTCPGTQRHNPNRIWKFYFGQYCISIDGDGYCRLYEQPSAASSGGTPPPPDGSAQWPLRHTWRYAEPSRVCGVAHSLAIWPTRDRAGSRYIIFSNGPQAAIGTATAMRLGHSEGDSAAQTIYNVDSGIRGTDVDNSPGYITRSDLIRIDTRRDLRVTFQISTLAWQTNGSLTDFPDSMIVSDPNNPLTVSMDSYTPNTNCLITPTILDVSSNSTFVDGQDNSPYVVFRFQGDGTASPILYSYTLNRDQITQQITPGAFTKVGIRSLMLSGFNGDPASQNGSVNISDPFNALPRLRVRGSFSARVATSFVPQGQSATTGTYDVALFRGYVIRPESQRWGKPGRDYPNPLAADFALNLQGAWWRLKQRVETTALRTYVQDLNAMPDANGVYPPWKITDMIVDLIELAGYAPNQIAIDDNPIRLWPGKDGAPDEYYIKPETEYAEVVLKLARNYLGAYVIFDENAGTDGQWRLIYGAQLGDPPVINFVTSKVNQFAPDHILNAYPVDQSTGAPTVPVLSDPLNSRIVEPEFNMVYVTCPLPIVNSKYGKQISNFKHNPKAFDLQGFPAMSDPDHPDYSPTGIRVLYVCDTSLAGTASSGDDSCARLTQAAVDWLVCRLYDFTCHAQVIVPFRAPLVFVFDQAINHYRLPRYQDSVSLNGEQFIIKSCDPEYDSDFAQMANYELIQPIFDAE